MQKTVALLAINKAIHRKTKAKQKHQKRLKTLRAKRGIQPLPLLKSPLDGIEKTFSAWI